MKKFLLTLTILLTTLGSHAQMGKLFDADKQLSSSFTSQLYLDRDGFLWVATRNGLNKYDGYQFRVLKKSPDANMGMASNYVNCIMQDRNGTFYIGMYGALQSFNGYRFKDIKVHDLQDHIMPPYVTCFEECQNGDVMIGTSGHGLLRLTDGENAHQVGGALADIVGVHRMTEDSHRRLWLVTEEQGLICYDGSKTVRYFEDETWRTQLRSICEGDDGKIYIGTAHSGLYGQTEKGNFEHIPVTGDLPVVEIYNNKKGHMLLGYDGKGMGIFNPQTGMLDNNPYYCREFDLDKSKCYSIVEDQTGNVWLGLLQKGVFMQPRSESPFKYMGYRLGSQDLIGQACVTSVLIDSRGWSWIGTDKDGLYCINEQQQLIHHYKDNFPSTVLGLAEDKHGHVWIGTYREGCGWIDTKTKTLHKQSLPQGPTISVFDLDCDSQGNLWMATMGNGLLLFNTNTWEVKAYEATENAVYDRKKNCIINNYISQLSLSPDEKRIYVATTMGVCCMDIATQSWTKVFGDNTLNYGTPTRIAREYQGKLWIGTNNGLSYFDLKTKKTKHLTTEEVLADNGIASIQEDHEGMLWIGTDHGLCRYDPKTQLTQSFFVDNGLQSNEFSDGASYTAPNGVVLLGGVGGVTWFTPSDIKSSNWKAEVKLTAFSINGTLVTPETKSGWYQVTDTSIIASDRFVLSHNDNSFAIQLSTLTYDNPEHITYRYRINNEEWVRLQPGSNEITFSHMAPGNYNFCVVAQRNNQVTEERCFTVYIHAPWYRTWLAYVVYLLILGLIVWRYLHYLQQQEQNHLRLQEYIHAEEMGEAKLRFFMNISHEIRTPMTLIVSPLLSLIKQDNDPHRRSIYETIRRNAERILGLINQMMDLRKIDKGQMQMHMCETDLISFVGDIHTLFIQQAKAKNILLNYEYDTQLLPVWIDRDNFDKVIVNILSNAFKFTPTGGIIRIHISHDDKQATIRIYDNGEKIPEDKLEHIFERFYQSPSTINDRNTGTGIGLDLTRSLVELHHGTITAQNKEKGCEFTVVIPLGNKHLKPEEIVTEEQQATPTTSLFDEIPPEVSAKQGGAIISRSHRQQQIVIAEDDKEIREYLVQELSNDYKITACENGKIALTEMLKNVPDLLISDIMMPEMDGNTLCSKVKSNPSTSHVPVILLTAKNRDEDQLEGLETGADSYIVKPFNMDILRRTIINLIHTHRMLRLKYGRNDQLEQKVDDVQMKSPDDKLLERVMTVINKNISNAELSVDAIADEVGISRVHLHRKMKELTGQTPHDFIRNIRLKQAANLLSNQNMNITEVMFACGFNNTASFSTIFKKFYGMSPREYMNKRKEGE